MKIRRYAPTLLPMMLLALAGCDEAPLVPDASAPAAISYATPRTESAATVASRSQCVHNPEWTNSNDSDPGVKLLLHMLSPSQKVVDQDAREWRFRANVRVWDDDGNACGGAQLESRHENEYYHLYFRSVTIASQDERRIVLEFDGEVESCSRRAGGGSDCRTGVFEATAVQQEHTGFGFPTNCDPVDWQWQLFYAEGGYSFAFEAYTRADLNLRVGPVIE
jgi:hypothetical protein